MSERLSKPERDEAEKVINATGDLNLGSGMWFRLPRASKDGATRSPSLMWRYTSPAGQRREMGLGKLHRTNVAEVAERLSRARLEVAEYREQLRKAIDPLSAKAAKTMQARAALDVSKSQARQQLTTLARVAREYHERVVEPNRSTKHAAQWIQTLETHVPAEIWHAPIVSITPKQLLDFFLDVTRRLPETGSRIIQRLQITFGDAEFRELRSGNPAKAAGQKLKEFKVKRRRGQHAALPYVEAPAFMQRLGQQPGIAARALEFAAMTASRTGEVIGAVWSEFDLPAAVWVIPGIRMKGGKPHVVYLSARALAIMESMREFEQPFVFPSPRLDGKPLSNMAMLSLLRRMDVAKSTTVHGFCRATFSTWANEKNIARSEVIEACLAHRESNLVRAAYNRAQFTQERRALLNAWCNYLEGSQPASNVVELHKAA